MAQYIKEMQMARMLINFGIKFALAIFVLALSVSANTETSCDPKSPDSCSFALQLCASEGPFVCCDGLQCVIPPKSGTGMCIPGKKDEQIPSETVPKDSYAQTYPATYEPTKETPKPPCPSKCSEFAQPCQPNGFADLHCCGGLDCIYPPMFGGIGVCADKSLIDKVPLIDQVVDKLTDASGKIKCQSSGKLCNAHGRGPLECCGDLSCLVIGAAVGGGFCATVLPKPINDLSQITKIHL